MTGFLFLAYNNKIFPCTDNVGHKLKISPKPIVSNHKDIFHMGITFLIIEFIIGFIFGGLFAYFFVKGKPNLTTSQLQAQLENERTLHKQTKQSLDDTRNKLNNATRELQEEQEIINAKKEKAKVESELREAINTISKLNTDIENFKTEVPLLQNEIVNLKITNTELSAKYQESLKAIEDQKKSINEANTALRDAFNSLSTQAAKIKEISEAFMDEDISDPN